LQCKRTPHSLYLLDLALADFHLFSVLKQKLQGIDGRDDEELKSEMLTIFQGFPPYEPKKSFDYWTEKCQWVAANAENDSPS
jgi:hypothetical protein